MKRLSSLLFIVMMLTVVGVAFGSSNIFDDTVSACTGNNCSSLRVPGTVLSFPPSAGNWIINAFAAANECMRLDVINQGADLEIVAVAPNGSVFRNDDRGGFVCPLCPQVRINGTQNGWYAVRLAHFAGSAVNANFTLLYGRYPLNNPNCANPTVPVAAPAANGTKDDGGASPAAPGQPGHE